MRGARDGWKNHSVVSRHRVGRHTWTRYLRRRRSHRTGDERFSFGQTAASAASAQTGPSSDGTLSQYTSIVEAYRGATLSNAGAEQVAPGQRIEQEVTDSNGSYSLQVSPIVLNGQVLNGVYQLQAFDHRTQSVTLWVVGSDGYQSTPVQEQPSSVAPINSTTPPTAVPPQISAASANATSGSKTVRKPDRKTQARPSCHCPFGRHHLSGTDCYIYGYTPVTEYTEYGWLIDGASEDYCPTTPSTQDDLDSELYEFDDYTWLELNSTENATGVGTWYTFWVDTYEPCNDYNTTSWVYNTQAYGAVTISGTEYWGSTGGNYRSVPCAPIY